MNTIFTPAVLTGPRGELIILEKVCARARIDDLFAKVEIEQRYRNTEETDIEAVYTFPVAMDAVLLGFELEINGHAISGTVMKKQESEERYEDAIDRGDSAGLLEKTSPGLYSVSIGNLRPGETATIRYRYGQFLRWNGNRVRFTMPTTIAPRYGDPEAAGLKPHQTPEHTFDAQRSFHLEISVRGILKDANLSSPSHTPHIVPMREHTVIALGGVTAMDRDVVIEAKTQNPNVARALVARDREGWVGLASFRPEIPEDTKPAPRAVVIIVDCSGSMNGDSITLARDALERILDSLHEGDVFDIIAFGSDHHALFDGRVKPVSPSSLAKARAYVRQLDANMGGTKIGKALQAAYRTGEISGLQTDLLLITDGQIWDKDIVKHAKKSGCRIFPVGIGVSPTESFLSKLAGATGGVCEFVSPREDIAARIHRHFQRLYCAKTDSASISWPEEPRQNLPDTLKTVYDGDTLHVFAWFDQKPQGEARLTINVPKGQPIYQNAPVQEFNNDDAEKAARRDRGPGTLARMAAAHRIAENPETPENADLALAYQLISPWTNYIVEHVREDGQKADGQPALRKIPQEVAAGWHGIGSAVKFRSSRAHPHRRVPGTGPVLSAPSAPEPSRMRYMIFSPKETFGLRPAFANRTNMDVNQPPHSDSPVSEPWPLNEFDEKALSLIAWQITMRQIQANKRRIGHPYLRQILATAINGKPLSRNNLADVVAPDMGMEWITRVLHQPLLVHPDGKLIEPFWIQLPVADLQSGDRLPDDKKTNIYPEIGKAMLDAWKTLIGQGCKLRFAVLVCDAEARQYLLFELDTTLNADPDQFKWEVDEAGEVDQISNVSGAKFLVGKDKDKIWRFSWGWSGEPLVWRNLKFGLQVPATAHLLRLDAEAMEKAKNYLQSNGKQGACPVWKKIELA